MEVRAVAREVGIAPRKVRLVLNMVRGKKVEDALTILRFTQTPTARVVAKAIQSAAANAESSFQVSPADLRIIRVMADGGPTAKRFMPRSRGRASHILKRSSHITVVVAEQER